MPRALKTCSTTTCPELVPIGQGRCGECKREAERRRGSAASRGYDARWARRRDAYLRYPEHLFCVLCGAASSVADHYPLSRRDLVAQGVRDPDAWRRLRPLCKPCHDHSTATAQPGGFNIR
ncbi:hypothetical protein GCM10010199_62010 [Dactylosporangium roseum]